MARKRNSVDDFSKINSCFIAAQLFGNLPQTAAKKSETQTFSIISSFNFHVRDSIWENGQYFSIRDPTRKVLGSRPRYSILVM